MRLLWSIHLYPPKHNCGAEYVAHNVNRYMLRQGNDVRVMLHYGEVHAYEYEGVDVRKSGNLDTYGWGEVLLTHLDYSQHTTHMGKFAKRPVIHFVHNDSVYDCIINAERKQYVVYNSKWIKDKLNYNTDSMVLYPPCPMAEYKVTTQPGKGEFITMLNINENKGGYLLYRLAKAMPERRFLGVKGSYDEGGNHPATIVEMLSQLPNVVLKDHTPNVKEFYKNTRILLALSRYESWGRVATEALMNGIPVIACPTEGLKENLDFAGLFVPARGELTIDKRTGEIINHDGFTYEIAPVMGHIVNLDNPKRYEQQSYKCSHRANELEIERAEQMHDLLNFISHAKQDYQYNSLDTIEYRRTLTPAGR